MLASFQAAVRIVQPLFGSTPAPKCLWSLSSAAGLRPETASDGGTAFGSDLNRFAMFRSCFVVLLCTWPSMCARPCTTASHCRTACQYTQHLAQHVSQTLHHCVT